MDLIKRSLSKWIQAAIILTIGILCIVIGASNDMNTIQSASDSISIIVGIVLVIVGSLSIILAVMLGILAKKGFLANSLIGGFALAIGISLLCNHYAAGLLGLLIYIVPFILLVIGSIILAEGIYLLVRGTMAKKTNSVLVPAIVTMTIGIVAVVLGALCVNGNVISGSIQFVVFGIVLCAIAAFMVLLTFVRLPDAIITVVKVDKE